mgnify:CR=1 FL=1
MGGDVARRFFAQVLGQAERADLLSKEHFSVDGTMIEDRVRLSDPLDAGSELYVMQAVS